MGRQVELSDTEKGIGRGNNGVDAAELVVPRKARDEWWW